MIDEKKLAEEIRDLINSDAFKGHSPAAVLYEVYDRIMEMPKAGGWIPCSERLPDDSGYYLTTIQDGEVCYVGKNWFAHTGDYYLEKSEWRELCDDEEVLHGNRFQNRIRSEKKMDAIRYLKEKARMTERCAISCSDCPLSNFNNGESISCNDFEMKFTGKAVAIMKKWAAEHPVKTRQTEFLKMFPNAKMEGGAIQVNPCTVDTKNVPYNGTVCDKYDACNKCRRDYWLAEV